MDDEPFFVIVFVAAIVLIGTGIIHFCMDYRLFDDVNKECINRGYIQDGHTRIICKPEPPTTKETQ